MYIEKTNDAKKIGVRLKEARINAGYHKIEEIIKVLGIPRTTYVQYESGARNISIEYIPKLCGLLKTNLIWIITGMGSPSFSDEDLTAQVNDFSTHCLNQNENISVDEFIVLAKSYDINSIKNFISTDIAVEDSILIDKIITAVKDLFLKLNINVSTNDLIHIITTIHLIYRKNISQDNQTQNFKYSKNKIFSGEGEDASR